MEDKKEEEVKKQQHNKLMEKTEKIKKTKIAAFDIHQKEKWIKTNRRLREKKFNYSKVRIGKNGVDVQFNLEGNYRKMNAYLRRKNIELYTTT